MKILCTGGAGYLGSILTSALLNRGHKVTVLDNIAHRVASLNGLCANHNLDVVVGDCRDERTLKPALAEADAVLPLAAVVGMPACAADSNGAYTTNVNAVGHIVRLASKDQRIVIPITNSGYGVGGSAMMCTEDSPLRPVSLYGRTKVDAEKIVLDRGNAISLRFATLFGMSPRMRLDLMVNDFVHRALTDRALVLFEGGFRRNYLHVRDAAGAFLHALANFDAMKDRPYNVGLSSANLTKRELCGAIRARLPEFTFFEAPVGKDPDRRDYLVSNERIEAAGFRAGRTLDDGIVELIKGIPMLLRSTYWNA